MSRGWQEKGQEELPQFLQLEDLCGAPVGPYNACSKARFLWRLGIPVWPQAWLT